MKIISVKAYMTDLPLKKPYTIAYKVNTHAQIVYLELALENGMIGFGAASPLEDVVGETPTQTLANLQTDYVQQLIGKDIRHMNSIIDEATAHFKKKPGTIAAIDIALHDLFAQYLQIPIADFYGRKYKKLLTSVTIGIKNVEETLADAKEYYDQDFKILKIKTGLNVEEDIERLIKLYEKYRAHFHYRVDANQGYTLEQLKHFIKSTNQVPLELIEQPLPVGKEDELRALCEVERDLLVADESLLNAQSALQLAVPPYCFGNYNIKLMKCGGIKEALRIGTIAQSGGIKLFWGCNDESIVSITAAIHAAFACRNTKYLDLDGSFDIMKDMVDGGFILEDGYLMLNDLPGLGVKKI